MRYTITNINLPTNPGCQHINVELIDDLGRKESRAYHMNDFLANEITQMNDPIYLQLKTVFMMSGKNTKRETLKTLFNNLSLEK